MPPTPFRSKFGSHLWLAVVVACGVLSSVRATEWDDLLGTLGNFTTRAGGPFTGGGNPNEWNVSMEGGPALTAELSEPHMAMDDIWGNIYVADKNAHAIRKITPDGLIFTVAGRHVYFSPNHGSYDGDGVATQKALSYPNGLFVFPDGTFYFLETGDTGTLGRIRKVDRSGMMTTLYSDTGGNMQRGLWVAPDESYLYFCTNQKLKRWTATAPAAPTTLLDLSAFGSADFSNIDVAANGNIFVTDRGRHRIYSIPPNSVNLTNPSTVAGTGNSDTNTNNNGNLLALGRDNVTVTTIPLDEVRGIAFHPLGGYFVACHKGGDIYYVDTGGLAHVLIQGASTGATQSGEGLPVTSQRNLLKIAEPRSVRVGWHGDIILCTNDNGFVRVVPCTASRTDICPTYDVQHRLTWSGIAGQAYFIERSTTLLERSWQTVAHYYPALNGEQSYENPIPPELMPRCFYRVYGHRKWPF